MPALRVGDAMSQEGLALNDCHAEILATRCLRDFFYTQLSNLQGIRGETNESIFEVISEDKDGKKFYQLKENVQFHLYINTAPCGDARCL